MPATNKVFAIAGVPCFADTFVQGGSSVLRMKFSAKTPRHRKPPKRWASFMYYSTFKSKPYKLFVMEKNRINTIINCLLVSAIFVTSCKSPTSSGLTDTDKQHFRDVTSKVQDGWNRGEREPYVNRFSPDAIYMAPNMKTLIGKEAIQTFANSFPEVKIEFSIKEIMGSAEYAYVRGTFIVKNPGDTLLDKGKFLSVWKKFPDNNWLLTHDIFNSDLPASVVKEDTDQKK